jgi:deoxycytidine triphosphate deaminase
MILGVSELLRLVREKNLVENLAERELANPEGAGFDFRIGVLYKVKGKGFLGVEERETPATEEIARYVSGENRPVALEPNVYYVMKTIERVNTPDDIAVLLRPRSTLYRSGVALFTGNVSPGYRGEFNFGIINLRDEPFTLEMGARVCHAMFYQVVGETAPYRGQWQGGRTATDGKEKQV